MAKDVASQGMSLNKTLRGARERERLFRKIVEHMSEAVIIVDTSGVIREVNPAAEKLLEYSAEDMVGKKFPFAVHSGKPGYHPIPFQQLNIKRGNSGELIAEMRVVEMKLRGKTYFMANIRDITELAKLREERQKAPIIDETTGLFNKRGLMTLAQYQIAMADKEKRGMLLFLIVLENLQRIRKALGDGEANLLLNEAASVLRKTFRASDIIARIDENEFALIAIGANKNSAQVLLARLQEKLKAWNFEKSRKYKLMLSVGVAYYDPQKPCSIDNLLLRAEKDLLKQ